jgi:DNA polymerase elongation subunit (family B)
MSYIDAILDNKADRIFVVERSPEGKRVFKEYPTNYTFYYSDPKGKFRSIFGDSVSRFSSRKKAEFEKEKRIHRGKQLFESDINTVFRCLSDNYLNVEPPKLHTAFFDIEVDFDRERGYSPTDDPFNSVTAISVYLDWLEQLVTLVMPPKHMSDETAQELTAEFENCLLFRSEIEMFETFFALIEDADVLTGWNSEGYDIPYCVNRVTRIMSKDDTRKFCLLGQLPKPRTYERFGKEEQTYDLIGRIHMDYLQLYKKYNYESRHSYSLDAIGEYELGERKTQYEGSLDQLYNKDFKLFVEYNRQDTMLVYKIHNKLKFLDLANALAHENTVLLPTVMGSVAMIEMAIYNEAHARDMIVPDKKRKDSYGDEQQAAGAYVAVPKKGIHEWVGAVDINSLYPSAIRALNMAPETIVGQVRQTLTDRYMHDKSIDLAKKKRKKKNGDDADGVTGAILWENLFGSLEYTAIMNQERGTMLTIDYEDGRSVEMSAAEIWKLIFDSHRPWMISANGTIFTYEKEGIIPGLLSRWYSERKETQKLAREAYGTDKFEYYDKRQLVRKILLNSAYGALLNEHCRFYDKRIGQSVTLSGRQITKHMMSQINEIITEKYEHDGDAIVYGDTDSCYFSAYPILKEQIDTGQLAWDKESCIQLYDHIAEITNTSFPSFMEKAFHCPRKNGEVIKAGRELIGDRTLFITKKRYAINIFDLEGKRQDLDGKMGKVKAMGLDLKRADTPKYVQEFLMEVLMMVLGGAPRDEVITKIREFKTWLSEQDPWTKGSPKSVNNLTNHTIKFEKTGKCGVGHARAAINYNYLRKMNGDQYSQKIVDGMKVVVCSLKDNALGFTSVAYPTDELRLPKWFTDLPFDALDMERKLVDEKIDNLLGVLNWKIRQDTNTNSTVGDLFDFG